MSQTPGPEPHSDQQRYPVEVFTRYSTTVTSMTEAWAFVMSRIDACGEDPNVSIAPQWTVFVNEDDEQVAQRQFFVTVSGAVDEPAPGGADT